VTDLEMLRRMMLIRTFESALLSQPGRGFQLLSSGEEAVAVGACAALGADDMLLTSGRSIGPALARGLDPGAVLAELLGKDGGPCRGRAGRGHIAQPSAGLFGAHAVVAGNIAVAVGAALAAQIQRPGSVVACMFGDGACGAGILYESMNIASVWRLPIVFVCNNNHYSVSTRALAVIAANPLAELARPFRIPAVTVDGMDVLAVRDAVTAAVLRARDNGGPSFLDCESRRFHPHSTLTRETRSADELARDRERCPIRLLEAHIRARGELDDATCARLQREVSEIVAAAVRFAAASPFPDPEEALRGVD
jgi:pyruvate dehydrogenase E1 component alpha subunit